MSVVWRILSRAKEYRKTNNAPCHFGKGCQAYTRSTRVFGLVLFTASAFVKTLFLIMTPGRLNIASNYLDKPAKMAHHGCIKLNLWSLHGLEVAHDDPNKTPNYQTNSQTRPNNRPTQPWHNPIKLPNTHPKTNEVTSPLALNLFEQRRPALLWRQFFLNGIDSVFSHRTTCTILFHNPPSKPQADST